jgi:hypothetical protein
MTFRPATPPGGLMLQGLSPAVLLSRTGFWF